MERTAQWRSRAFSLRMVARRQGSYSGATRAHMDGGSGTLDSAAHGGGAQSTGSGDGEHEEEETTWLQPAAADKARWWIAQAGSAMHLDVGRAGDGW
jgi:hypothetical protein